MGTTAKIHTCLVNPGNYGNPGSMEERWKKVIL
jgi:hypothetical protein